jgi:hypothetical protein
MNDLRSARRLGAGLLSVSMLLAACSSAAGPSSSPTPVDPTPDTPVTAPPSNGSGNGSDPGGIGDGPKSVDPKPGQLNLHPVPADELSARVDGDRIIVTATWTSGVEPCYVLDTIVVDKGEGSFAITLVEGNGPEEIACIMIAEQHVTEFEIPDVAPGTYEITDSTGGAAPIEVTVG